MNGLAVAFASFNLVCSGTSTSISDKKTEQPYTELYRVDLDAKKWCAEDCKAILPIVETQPSYLLLLDQPRTDPIRISIRIDRETGEHFKSISSKYLYISNKGKCEKSPFSGFPKIETKF